MTKKRKYISIYFRNGHFGDRKRRDLTIAMDPGSGLYRKYKDLNSPKIKKLIGVKSYKDLVYKAKRADRTLSGYIKHKLRQKLSQNE